MICVTIGWNREKLISLDAEARARGADLVEYRLDTVINSITDISSVKINPKGSILTFRPKPQGGYIDLPYEKRLQVLKALLKLKSEYIDIEWDIARKYPSIIEESRKIGVKTIISWHFIDSHVTMKEVRTLKTECLKMGDYAKIVFKSNAVEDLREVTRLYVEDVSNRRRIIAFTTGKYSMQSRIIAYLLGMPILYSYLEKPFAEGQPSIEEAKEIVRGIGKWLL